MNTQTLLILLFGAGAAGLAVAASSVNYDDKFVKFLGKLEERFYPNSLGIAYGMVAIGARKQGMSVSQLVGRNVKAGEIPNNIFARFVSTDLANLAKAAVEVSEKTGSKSVTYKQALLNLLTSIEGGSQSKAEAALNDLTKAAKAKGFDLTLSDKFDLDLSTDSEDYESVIYEVLEFDSMYE